MTIHIAARRLFLILAIVAVLAATASAADKLIRVACVGDSITFGAGVENREVNNYPAVLGRVLGDGYEVRNFGVSGATLLKHGDKPYWDLPAFRQASEFQPQIVVIKLGTNDTKPQNWKFADEFTPDMAAMIDHFRSLDSKPVVYLCRPAPVVHDRWGINEATVVGEVIPQVNKLAEEKNCPVIDIYAALKDHSDLLPDGVHPNAAGAKILAETVAAAIRKPGSP